MQALFKRYWKYGVAGLAGVLWCAGLIDQAESLELTARYVGLSLALVVVAAAA
jgi:hypothetical protein